MISRLPEEEGPLLTLIAVVYSVYILRALPDFSVCVGLDDDSSTLIWLWLSCSSILADPPGFSTLISVF